MKHARRYLMLFGCFAAFLGIGWVLPRLVAERRGPRLECQTEIDLGECEAGEMVTRPFPIRNAGDATLHLSAIQSACGCVAVCRKVGEEFERLAGLAVEPAAFEELFLRVRVGAAKDASGTVALLFLTNDPSRPEAKISIRLRRVRAGVEFRPPELNLGRLDPGQVHRFAVDVFDDPKSQRSIAEWRSNLPECVRARFVPAQKGLPAEAAAAASVQLGRVEVEVESERPAELFGEILLLSGDAAIAPIRLAVSGAVRPWLEFHPARLLLPRRSSEGWVSQATVVCRFPAGVSGTVEIGPTPAGVLASAEPVGDLWHVRPRLDLEKVTPGDELVVPLRWRAAGRSVEEQLRVQVNSAYAR